MDVGRIRSDALDDSTAAEGHVEGPVVPTSALAHVASASGFSKNDLVAIGQREGVQLWKASNSSFSQRAISVRNSIPEADGAVQTHQFVLTDDAHEAEIASVEGLRNIGHDLFVDTRADERTDDQITTFGAEGAVPTSEAGKACEPANYALALSATR